MKLLILAGLACLTVDIATAQVLGTTISSEGNWDLRKSDAGSCVLTPKTPSRVQVTRGRISVTGMPKNSVFNYQYRVDDGDASTPVLPSEAMQAEGRITIEGDAFNDTVEAHRFRFRILDRWHEAISEDIDLAGLSALYKRLEETCK
ncbi:hypothetical protein FV222_12060 [Methylobacterium sp. WL103]|uniref:hypothetical protein n=1 Tax=Methylobacterium sp. WL103 TaxID=2603891 RepID=UPI0011CAB238|nr:hypothetical protein [Methylobacterium sp. WL103]TXN00226.1 hypothetical protein FV222_12060 [Methylobacterium sp. WL103]